MTTLPPAQQVYVDASGMDERDDYGYSWYERGKRFEALHCSRRTGWVNLIAADCEHQWSAPFTVTGACHRVVFETWLETCLLPTLVPGQVVILDHATFQSWRTGSPTACVNRLSVALPTPLCARFASD